MTTATATFWNKLAERYAAQPVGNPDAFEKKIAAVRSMMTPDDVILAIGCGTGSLSLRLCDIGATHHGVDISEEMIRIARDKVEAAGVDNVTFHVAPFDRDFTVFGPESLSGALAFSILHLLPNRTDAIAQLFELLKPGGFFASSTVVLGDSWVPYGFVVGAMRMLGKAPWVESSLSADGLMDEMRAAGFVDVVRHDVGAKPTTAFITARKPA